MGPGWKRSDLVAVVVGFHDHAADDVGGHEVGRELDARVADAERAREGAEQSGLAESGDAFEQDMSGGEQADENAIDHALLADDDFADFVAYFVEFRDRRIDGGFRCHSLMIEYRASCEGGSRGARARIGWRVRVVSTGNHEATSACLPSFRIAPAVETGDDDNALIGKLFRQLRIRQPSWFTSDAGSHPRSGRYRRRWRSKIANFGLPWPARCPGRRHISLPEGTGGAGFRAESGVVWQTPLARERARPSENRSHDRKIQLSPISRSCRASRLYASLPLPQ